MCIHFHAKNTEKREKESCALRELKIFNYETEPIQHRSIYKYTHATHDDLIRKHFKSFRYLRKFG